MLLPINVPSRLATVLDMIILRRVDSLTSCADGFLAFVTFPPLLRRGRHELAQTQSEQW